MHWENILWLFCLLEIKNQKVLARCSQDISLSDIPIYLLLPASKKGGYSNPQICLSNVLPIHDTFGLQIIM